MSELNIDAELDAAKAEVTGEDHVLTFRGQLFKLPPKANFLRLSDAYRQQDAGVTARVLLATFGDEQYARLLDMDLDVQQCGAVLQAVSGLYGWGSVPESSASSDSSLTNGARSRPTSSVSTG